MILLKILILLFLSLFSFSGQTTTTVYGAVQSMLTSNQDEVDYIVLGAGTAGSIMASKLSEDPNIKVLLVERGEWDSDPYIYNTSDWYDHWFVHRNPLYSHDYVGQPEPNLNNARPSNIVGTMVGGCSGHNGMLANSGSAKFDWEKWGEETNAKENWSGDVAKGLLQEFLADIPLVFQDRDRTWLPEIGQAIEKSLGFQWNRQEFVNLDQTGYSTKQHWFTPQQWKRITTYSQMIKDNGALNRPNLHVVVNQRATKMEYESLADTASGTGFKVTGVWIQNTQTRQSVLVKVRKEVILSMGAIESPKFLQLNGIGERGHLSSLGITTVVDSPGVGMNYQDHSSIMFFGRPLVDSLKKIAVPKRGPVQDGYSIFGPLDAAATSGNSYTMNVDIDNSAFFCYVEANRPKSRGHVKITSTDPYADPDVYANFFDHPQDLEDMIKGLTDCFTLQEELTNMGILDAHGASLPLGLNSSREAYINYIKQAASTDHHLTSSVKMGAKDDRMSPLDGNLLVKGVSNIRVVDASVLPSVPSANTAVPASLVALQAFKIIKSQN
ncbi:glucose-methanol-choline oxidoreductase [Cavenderia fasciculata]|uniref:Glucose-methanol-choline oxidoreductase n=1 Tax=Cavenderia fasciculata TaxID=261658 RepID=F4PP74_CACFS|nr:glucose-methanol-choline oxidoreductase [Cavenderia fasciculata]EGG22187.1 glucose-methanol-choline oxidoreductase [Cavenderia fasciculata]|eukprot:XP_004360038.1 glucose-methanol-choline oxidoreductase [Cavenderia fasciculata]